MQKTLPLYILGGLIVVCFFAMCACLIFFTVPAAQAPMVWAFFGILGAAFTAVVQYFYGSSSGSAAKTEMMNAGAMIEAAKNPGPVVADSASTQSQPAVADSTKAPSQPV